MTKALIKMADFFAYLSFLSRLLATLSQEERIPEIVIPTDIEETGTLH